MISNAFWGGRLFPYYVWKMLWNANFYCADTALKEKKMTFSLSVLCPTKMDTSVSFHFPIWNILEWQLGTCPYRHDLALWLQHGPGLQATTVLFGEFVFSASRVRNSVAECEGMAGIWGELNQWALFKAEGRAWKTTSSEEVMEDDGGRLRSAEMRRGGVPGTQREFCGKGCLIWAWGFLPRNQSGLCREGGQGTLTLSLPTSLTFHATVSIGWMQPEARKPIDAICFKSGSPDTRQGGEGEE